jgi:hypothetical protein
LVVYRADTAKALLSAAHFTETFHSVPKFYFVKEYRQGYSNQVERPILTCLELDSTLPTSRGLFKQGKVSIKWLQGLAERNYEPLPGVGKKRTRKGENPHKKTAKNLAECGEQQLRKTLQQGSCASERILCVAAVHVEEEESEKEDELAAEQRDVEMAGELSKLGW